MPGNNSFVHADPPVGKIRRNKDKTGNTNVSFTSDDDKLIKSQLRNSEVFEPSRQSSILKPKHN